MKTMRLTMAQALVRYLCAQQTEIDGRPQPLFAGVFAIFGHGNVTCLSEALEAAKDRLPTWRGQNEQSMALAGVGFAKARLRRQIMVATSSIGPGATNMVTAAAVAHSNRLPLLLLSGRYVRQPLPRSGPAAGGALRCTIHHGERCVQGGDPLLGPHRAARADSAVAAAGGRHHAGSRRLRAGLPRAGAGRAGRGFRLSGCILRADAAPHSPPAPRQGRGAGGRRRACAGPAAAHHRRGRGAVFAGCGGAGCVCATAQHACGGDHRRSQCAGARASDERGAAWRDRVELGECAGRRSRRGGGDRHAPAGLHHRLVDRVRQPRHAPDRNQCGPLRRQQASRAGGGGGCARSACRTGCSARGLPRAAGMERQGEAGLRCLEPHRRRADRARQETAAQLCAGGGGGQPQGSREGSRAHCRRRPAGRAGEELARRNRSARSIASSASPAWATRSRAGSGRRWPRPTPMCW